MFRSYCRRGLDGFSVCVSWPGRSACSLSIPDQPLICKVRKMWKISFSLHIEDTPFQCIKEKVQFLLQAFWETGTQSWTHIHRNIGRHEYIVTKVSIGQWLSSLQQCLDCKICSNNDAFQLPHVEAMEVVPVNSAERMYAIVVIFSGLVSRPISFKGGLMKWLLSLLVAVAADDST